MHPGVPRRRRARPVADAPIDPLLARVDDLAKGWLVALLEQLPLARASSVLAAELSRDGPRICDAVIRALADDNELRRLGPEGALESLASRAGDVSGGDDAATASAAIDALYAVIWSALRSELIDPGPEQVSELAERLALIIETVRGATLRRPGGVEAQAEADTSSIDADRPEADIPRVEPDIRGVDADIPRVEPDIPGVEPPPLVAAEPPRSARSAEALWVGAFEEEIARATRAGMPLALLLAELEESEQVAAVEPPAVAAATIGRFAQAIRNTVRRSDILAAETDSRVWIIARDTGRKGAQALGSRVARAVRNAEPWRGAPLTIAVGIAILGEDGREAERLMAVCEESRFAAAASGIPVVGGGEEPSRPYAPPPQG